MLHLLLSYSSSAFHKRGSEAFGVGIALWPSVELLTYVQTPKEKEKMQFVKCTSPPKVQPHFASELPSQRSAVCTMRISLQLEANELHAELGYFS